MQRLLRGMITKIKTYTRMKIVEKILYKAYKKIELKQSSSHEDVDPVLIEAMKEYARIQIEKDRERIDYTLSAELRHWHDYTAYSDASKCIDITPIILD